MEQKLDNIRLFNNLEAGELEKIIDHCYRCSFVEGEYIFKEGDESDSFHIIVSGSVEVFTLNKINQDIELIKLGAGTTIGEVGFIDGKERTASVKCISTTSTLSLSKNEFANIVENDSPLALKILKEIGKILSERLRWCDKLLVNDISISSKFLSAIESSH